MSKPESLALASFKMLRKLIQREQLARITYLNSQLDTARRLGPLGIAMATVPE